jgi:predicted secreted protein
MAHVLAENAKLYYNTGTYAAPTWTLITNVKDVTLSMEKDEIDVTTRASGGFKEFVDGLIDASVEFSMIWDTGNAAFTAIKAAFFAKTAVELLVCDGVYTVTGSQGLRAECMIKSFSRGENLGEALTVDCSARPVKNTNAAPSWYTKSA